ncbi:hypothetical protein SLEP1_g38551 [Rubroshorea leprosula]|nr:hypothetical protein SLEP1_g38551 [Rubroshorea leprosula]
MQEAIPYRTYNTVAGGSRSPPRRAGGGSRGGGDEINLTKLVVENAVVVFGRRGCCMCHVVKRLLLGHGVNPVVFEVEEEREAAVVNELGAINGGKRGGGGGGKDGGGVQFPAVFVGGRLFGGLDKVMSTHISGELVPILKDAKALWL